MDQIKKTIDDGLRRVRGKIELVKRPHVSVKEWLETQISASASFLSGTALDEQSNVQETSSSCSSGDTMEQSEIAEMLSKPSSLFSMNKELTDIFHNDDGLKMKGILDKGFDPNFLDSAGKPLIYRAVEDKKYNIIETMLEFGHGCDVSSVCQNDINCGWTALHLACHLVDPKAVQLLLGVNMETAQRRDVCDVHAVDSDKRSALHILCASKNVTAFSKQSSSSTSLSHVFATASSHATVTASIATNTVSNATVTASNATITASNATITASASSSTPNIASASSRSNLTASQTNTLSREPSASGSLNSKMAAMSCDKTVSAHVQIMKLLLKAGSGVNAQDSFRRTPLHICAWHGNIDGVRLLLRYGADIDLTDDHCETPLVKAVTHYHPSVVRTLLKQEHSISDIKRYELSELLWAMIEDLSGLSDEDKTVNEPKVIEIIRLLLRKRVYLNVSDCRRRTPLHLAVLYGLHGIASTLLREHSCDITLRDDEGFTPLFLAAWNPKKVDQEPDNLILHELIQAGADVNCSDTCRVYPVNAALESGQYRNACLLLAHGSHVQSADWFCSSVDVLRYNSSTLPFVQRFVLSMINMYHHHPLLIEVATILGQMDIVDMIIRCGAPCRGVNIALLHRWAHTENQEFIAQDLLRNIGLLAIRCRSLLDLKDLCRILIRSHIGSRLHAKADCLPLPERLKTFVKMTHYSKATLY